MSSNVQHNGLPKDCTLHSTVLPDHKVHKVLIAEFTIVAERQDKNKYLMKEIAVSCSKRIDVEIGSTLMSQ